MYNSTDKFSLNVNNNHKLQHKNFLNIVIKYNVLLSSFIMYKIFLYILVIRFDF